MHPDTLPAAPPDRSGARDDAHLVGLWLAGCSSPHPLAAPTRLAISPGAVRRRQAPWYNRNVRDGPAGIPWTGRWSLRASGLFSMQIGAAPAAPIFLS